MSMFMTLSANAAVVEIPTNSYVLLAPDTVQIGTNVVVEYRIDKVARGALDLTGHFNGTSIAITDPDGHTEVKDDLPMDSTSGGYFVYTPASVGTYKFQMTFPGQWVNGSDYSGPY